MLPEPKCLITGGAGFIGSHLADTLMLHRCKVAIIDNLSSGSDENIKRWLHGPNVTFQEVDILNQQEMVRTLDGQKIVFHMAANPEVRVGTTSPRIHFQQNIQGTYNILEAIRKTGTVETLVFTSTSTIYGEAAKIPTPEDYAPLRPISMYGASKLACEALISSYSHNYGFKAIIYRLANVVGPRSRHGVVYDFINKLKQDPKRLEILGDGTQTKSYLHITDCIDAILLGLKKASERVEIFNIGSEDQISVKEIADIVTQQMSLNDVEYHYTGGVDGGRGWKGDVKNMLLDTSRLKAAGWRPRLNSCQAIEETAAKMLRGN